MSNGIKLKDSNPKCKKKRKKRKKNGNQNNIKYKLSNTKVKRKKSKIKQKCWNTRCALGEREAYTLIYMKNWMLAKLQERLAFKKAKNVSNKMNLSNKYEGKQNFFSYIHFRIEILQRFRWGKGFELSLGLDKRDVEERWRR